jgi:diaminopimelate dehydrogenase
MAEQTRIAIVGWGNIGRGVRESIRNNPDMNLKAIFTRDPARVSGEFRKERGEGPMIINANIDSNDEWKLMQYVVDVAILCGGSKKDLPAQGPMFARHFNTVDSFDTHTDIPAYFAKMDEVARDSSHVSVVSAGWDPGTFSVERVMADAILPGSKPYAFYGLQDEGGLSMGHSEALRTLEGVADARQYTHSNAAAIKRARSGETDKLTAGDRMWRECFVVLETDNPAERQRVEPEVRGMPTYYKPYKTTVDFVTGMELARIDKERGMCHDGLVVAVGETGRKNRAVIEYANTWESNPEGTGNILVACARACYRMRKEGKVGAFTMADIPPAYYSSRSRAELLKDFM